MGREDEQRGEARRALRAIVDDPGYGAGTLCDAYTMSNLLKDYLPEGNRESSVLVAGAEAGLVASMHQHMDQGMDAATAIGITAAAFSASTSFTPQACTWATRELAVAAGLVRAATVDAYPDEPAGPAGPGGPAPLPPGSDGPSTISASGGAAGSRADGGTHGPSQPPAERPGARTGRHQQPGSADQPEPRKPPGRRTLLAAVAVVAAVVVIGGVVAGVRSLHSPAPSPSGSPSARPAASGSAHPSTPAASSIPAAAIIAAGPVEPLRSLLKSVAADCRSEPLSEHQTASFFCQQATIKSVFVEAAQYSDPATYRHGVYIANADSGYGFYRTIGSSQCPPPAGYHSSHHPWFESPKFPANGDQVLECTTGTGAGPTIVWTMPTQRTVWEAYFPAHKGTLTALFQWWNTLHWF